MPSRFSFRVTRKADDRVKEFRANGIQKYIHDLDASASISSVIQRVEMAAAQAKQFLDGTDETEDGEKDDD